MNQTVCAVRDPALANQHCEVIVFVHVCTCVCIQWNVIVGTGVPCVSPTDDVRMTHAK